MEEYFDLIVIGTGPAGEKAAVKAAFFGYKVAIIEKQTLYGGAETTTGTLPSKTLKETALFLSGKGEKGLYSVEKNLAQRTTVEDFLYRKNLVMNIFSDQIHENLTRHGVSIVHGMAQFVDDHRIQVGNRILKGGYILIATGSYPYHPQNIPFNQTTIHDSDTILSLNKIPSSLVIYGGGVIGTEYATIFATMGVKVTLIHDKTALLPFLDETIAEALVNALTEAGITLIMDACIEQVTQTGDDVVTTLKNREPLYSQMFLFAAGRSGQVQDLGLDKLGLQTSSRGQITVNSSFQTNIPHIYAAGDVVGFPSLASTSMEQGRVAVSHMFNINDLSSLPTAFPYGIYTIPEVSFVGKKESDMEEGAITGKAFYSSMPRGKILGLKEGFLKLIVEKNTLRITGCHIIGYNATELIHFGCLLVQNQKTVWDVVGQVFNFPTLHDLYKYAAYDALSQIDQLPFHKNSIN
jgi:NAD(P) transhydrogenase